MSGSGGFSATYSDGLCAGLVVVLFYLEVLRVFFCFVLL